jgi:UrcA family protein
MLRRTLMKRFVTLGAMAAMLAAATAPIAAHAASKAPVAVKVDDLDLTNAKDKAKLERRIATAARTMCGDGMATGSRIAKRGALDTCVADFRAEFDAKLNARMGG